MSFLSLFSFFVSLLSPYVYYSSVFTLCCKQLEQYDSFLSTQHRAITNSEVKAFMDAYTRYVNRMRIKAGGSVTENAYFNMLSNPIKRVGTNVFLDCRSSSTPSSSRD